MRNRDKSSDPTRQSAGDLGGAVHGKVAGLLAGAGKKTGKEFVAGLDLDRAMIRFEAIVNDPEVLREDAAIERYSALTAVQEGIARNPEDVAPTAAILPDEILINGVIRSFDYTSGFGFIVPDDGRDEVQLPLSALHAGGYTDVFEGATIRCFVNEKLPNLPVSRVVHLDNKTGLEPANLPKLLRLSKVSAISESDWAFASVVCFNELYEFGCLRLIYEASLVFCNAQLLRRYKLSKLSIGQRVKIRWGFSSIGRLAADLRTDIG
jgi:cold shock protein